MKAKKVLRELVKYLYLVVIIVCINLVIKVAMDGMWLFGIPNSGEVTSVTVKHQYRTEDIKEITDKDQIMYYNSGESVPVEPDESAIENIEIPVGGDATITEYAMLEDGKLLVCLIKGEWYKFLPVE